ncbi:MAG: ElyC/SanA/YdcF family protein [bacterium]
MTHRNDVAVVVFCPPRYKDAYGVEKIWLGRLHRGIELALHYNCPLVIVGDANGGKDNAEFECVARQSGVVDVVISRNGHRIEDENTRGDARAAYRALLDDTRLAKVQSGIFVTCWYHIPRTRLALWRARQEVYPECSVRWTPSAVWRKVIYGLARLLDFKSGELRGCVDYVLGRPQISRGEPMGKPDFVRLAN